MEAPTSPLRLSLPGGSMRMGSEPLLDAPPDGSTTATKGHHSRTVSRLAKQSSASAGTGMGTAGVMTMSGQVSLQLEEGDEQQGGLAAAAGTLHAGASAVAAAGVCEDESESHHWFVAFAMTRIDVPKQVWRAVAPLPGQPDTQLARRTVFGLPLLPPYHPAAFGWMAFMLFFDLIYTAFWTPLSVAFCLGGIGVTLHEGCSQANFFGGLVYTLNLIVSFSIGAVLQYDYEDYEVHQDGMLLANCYVKYGRFVIDVVGVLPFIALVVLLGLSQDTSQVYDVSLFMLSLSLLRLLRLGRLLSISKIVYTSALTPGAKGSLPLGVTSSYVLLLAYMLAMLLNLETCIMLMIALLEGYENSWLRCLQWLNFVDANMFQQYFNGLYWIITTATTTGYGDVVPQSITEMVVANVYMLIGLVIFGLLVGTIGAAVSRASMDAHRWYDMRKKVDQVVGWLNSHRALPATKKNVKAYLTELWETQEAYEAEGEVFGDLPQYLRDAVASQTIFSSISLLKLLRSQDEGLRLLLAQKLRPVDVAPGTTLCEQGEDGDRLWVLVRGSLEASQYMADRVVLRADSQRPCIVGDSIILANAAPAFRTRSFTVRAELDSGASTCVRQLWELRASSLAHVLTLYPRFLTDTLHFVRDRTMLEIGLGDAFHNGIDFSGWCEASTCMARALKQQPADLIEMTMEGLSTASSEDGTLQQLLDSLLEFSISTARHKPLDLSGHGLSTVSQALDGMPRDGRDSAADGRIRGSTGGRGGLDGGPGGLQPAVPSAPADSGTDGDAPTALDVSRVSPFSGSGVATGPSATSAAATNVRVSPFSGGSGAAAGPSALSMTTTSGRTSAFGAATDADPSGSRTSPFGTVTGLLAAAAAASGGPSSSSGGMIESGRNTPFGRGGPLSAAIAASIASGTTASSTTASSGGGVSAERKAQLRAALGLPTGADAAPAQQWRPNRLGRQTLMRGVLTTQTSLSATSIPVQEFGAGYTQTG